MLLLQLIANGLVRGCFYALVATGYALIYNGTRTFHIAHGAIYTCAAYAMLIAVEYFNWTITTGTVFAILVAALLGSLVELLVYAPLARSRASLLVALLSSLGVYVVLVNVLAIIFGNDVRLLRRGLDTTISVGPVLLTDIQIATVISAVVVLPILLIMIRHTSAGRLIRAARDNSSLVSILGFDLRTIRTSLFAAGSALAAGAAVLTAFDVGMYPQMGMSPLLAAAVAVVIGGAGTYSGAVIGALLLGVIQGVAVWAFSAEWSEATAFLTLVVFQIIRPGGLMQRHLRVEEAT